LLLTRKEAFVGWVAAEANLNHANLQWATIDMERFLVARQTPDLPAFDAAEALALAGCDLVVIDSLAAVIGSPVDRPLYQVLSEGLPRLLRALRQTGSVAILTNQERHIPRSRARYTPGAGAALARLVNYKIRLEKGAYIYDAGIIVGSKIRFQVIRNGDGEGGRGVFNLSYSRGLYDRRRANRNVIDGEVSGGEESGGAASRHQHSRPGGSHVFD
jgi:hypothetical protein